MKYPLNISKQSFRKLESLAKNEGRTVNEFILDLVQMEIDRNRAETLSTAKLEKAKALVRRFGYTLTPASATHADNQR